MVLKTNYVAGDSDPAGAVNNTNTKVNSVDSTLVTMAAQIAALQAQVSHTTQILNWIEGDLSTNGTSYGAYDLTVASHEFKGSRDPVIAGYSFNPATDIWTQPPVPPVVLETIRVDDNKFTYSGGTWGTGTDTDTYNSSDHFINVAGKASFTWTCEAGGQMALLAKTAPHHGIANITIDGVLAGTADLYSATNTYKVNVFTSLPLVVGSHTAEVSWTGTKNASSSGTTIEVDAFDLAGAAVGTGDTNPNPGDPPPPLATGFLKRGTGPNGQKVYIEGSSTPYRATGVNLPWSQGCGASPQGLTPTLAQHTAMFTAAKPNSLYRIFLFGGTNLANFDAILTAARPFGHRFIVCLSDRANGCGEPYCGPNPRAFYQGGWSSGGWKLNHLTPVVLRYKNEPLIGLWEWVNEPHMDQDVRNFFDAVGDYVRNTLGDQHMIGTGTTSEYGNPSGMQLIGRSQYIDACSQHEYDYNEAPSHWLTADRADALAVGKPLYIGESGIKASQKAAGSVRAGMIQSKIAAMRPMTDIFAYQYWTGANPTGSWTGSPGYLDRMEVPITSGGPLSTLEIGVINTEPF